MARSQAFNSFLPVLRTSLELVSLDVKHFQDPPPLTQQDSVRGLRGGSAVLMVAGFEAFLQDLMIEKVQVVHDYVPAVIFSKLPAKMQETNVFQTLEGAMKGPKYGPPVERFDRLPEIKIKSSMIASDLLHPDAFASTGGNPGKASVRRLFKDIGINDIFSRSKPRFEKKWKSAVTDDFMADKLEEIVKRRHRVAHRADALSISRVELREGVRFLRALSETLDIEIGYYIRETCRLSR